jgi:hypothetical protein
LNPLEIIAALLAPFVILTIIALIIGAIGAL